MTICKVKLKGDIIINSINVRLNKEYVRILVVASKVMAYLFCGFNGSRPISISAYCFELISKWLILGLAYFDHDIFESAYSIGLFWSTTYLIGSIMFRHIIMGIRPYGFWSFRFMDTRLCSNFDFWDWFTF